MRLWDVQSGRCRKVWDFGSKVNNVQWNPNPETNILGVAVYVYNHYPLRGLVMFITISVYFILMASLMILLNHWMSNCCFDFRDKDVVLLSAELGGEEVSANVSALLTLKESGQF